MYDPNDYPEKEGGGGGGNLLPVGKHTVVVTNHELGTTSGGYDQIIVDFEAPDGRSRKAWLQYTGPAGFQLASLLRAVDWHKPLDVESDFEVRRAIYGIPVQIVVANESYNGETKPKIKYINKIAGGSRRETPPNTNGDSRNEAPPPGDEDIPF